MNDTIIAWATKTCNVVHGCSKPIETNPLTGRRFVSPECQNCYAEALSLKRGWTEMPWSERNEAGNVHLHPERFREFGKLIARPAWQPPSKRERIFICSMGDWAHRLVPDEFIAGMFASMVETPHIYQLLTKRIARAAQWPGPWPDHVWLGTTCGHPDTKFRIDLLRRSKAKVRFISMEPLLGSMLPLDLRGIHQVIVGGESGPRRRPMEMVWAREVRDACRKQGVAFFMKQASAFRTESQCYLVEEDGSCWQYRQFPGEYEPPFQVEPDNPKYHQSVFPVPILA